MVKAIIFDLWDTLAYHEHKCLPDLLREKICPDKSHYEFNEILEKTIQIKDWDSLQDMYTYLLHYLKIKPDDKLLKELIKITGHCLDNVGLFPETVEVLQKLKQKYKLALISNTFSFSLHRLGNGFEKYFDCVCYSYKVGVAKPDLRIFNIALAKLGVKPSEAVMVGDSMRVDITPALEVGMHAVLIDRKGRFDVTNKITSLNELFDSIEKLY